MDFDTLARSRLAYYPNADFVLAREIKEARNAYALQRLLGNSETSWQIKQDLERHLRQTKTELRGELQALDNRKRSVVAALKMSHEKVDWPLWPDVGQESHEDVMEDLMRNHRLSLADKLELVQRGKKEALAS